MAFSVVMPALEMAQETGKLIAWRKKEGDRVAKGEPLLEVETDKAVLEVESPADGILAGVTAAAGADIPVGKTIAWILAPGEKPPIDSESPASPPAARGKTESHAPPVSRAPNRTFCDSKCEDFPQGATSCERIRCGPRCHPRFRSGRRDPRIRCGGGGRASCVQRAPEARQCRSPEHARSTNGGAHHAKLDHRPALLRYP